MTGANVRYIVDDIDSAVSCYTALGFSASMRGGSGFVHLEREGLRLYLNVPGAGGAGQAVPGRGAPAPGGWNRIQIEVPDLHAALDELKQQGIHVPHPVVEGRGGIQVLLEDPSGNLAELFEPHP